MVEIRAGASWRRPRAAPRPVRGAGDWRTGPDRCGARVLRRARHGPCTPQELRGTRGRRAGPPDLSDPPALRVSGTTGKARAEFHNEGSWLDCLDGRRKDSRML
jgi:hypothetical protein